MISLLFFLFFYPPLFPFPLSSPPLFQLKFSSLRVECMMSKLTRQSKCSKKWVSRSVVKVATVLYDHSLRSDYIVEHDFFSLPFFSE